MFSLGHNHSLLLNEHGEVWTWGLSTDIEHPDLFIDAPIPLVNLSSIEFIKASGNTNYAIDSQGQLYEWDI